MISLQNVRFGYDGKALFQNLSCAFPDRALTCVIGPNGSGKSTCLKLCARLLRPQSGEILVDGQPASGYDARAFARALAFLPQSRPLPAITVRSLVSHGRFAYLGLSHRLRPADEEAVESALRGYKEINLRGLKLTRPGGFLVTCSCSQHVSTEAFQEMVNHAARDAKKRVRLVEYRTQAYDHPILPAAPETKYLKCMLLQVM